LQISFLKRRDGGRRNRRKKCRLQDPLLTERKKIIKRKLVNISFVRKSGKRDE
jgi:hypothetical protein